MRRLVLALLTVAIFLGIAPTSAQVLPVRVSLLRDREMLTLIVQTSDPASLLDFRFQYLDEYDREILIALRDYDQFRESSAGVTEACFVLRDFETETPVPQECLNITRTNLHVQELGTASLFWFDDVINLQRPLTILDVNGFVGVCPAENSHCEFEYPHAPPGEPPPPPPLFEAADLDNREILVLIAEFEQISGSPLQPHLEWQRVLDDAIAEVGVNARAELLPQMIRSHDEARTAAEQYGATLVIWGYVGAAAVSSQYTVTPRWSQVQAQPGETEVIGTLDELALFVSPGGDVEYVFNFVMAQLIYFTESDYERALTLIDQAIALAPEGREIEMRLGVLYFYRGYAHEQLSASPETRIEDYTRAIDLNFDWAPVYNNRGVAYYDLGDLERAIVEFEQAIARDPEYADAYTNRGNAYAALGDYERAITEYDQAIMLDPASDAAYNNRGTVYTRLRDYDHALTDYEQAIALNPENAGAYNNRGIVYTELGEFERAIADFDQAIVLDPTFGEAYNNRGVVYMELGDPERAITDYDQAIAFAPDFSYAYQNRGNAHFALGDYEQAIADYERAVTLDPPVAFNPAFARAYYYRGNAYYNSGNYNRAIADYDQAIALNPELIVAYDKRGFVYYELGNLRAAYQDFTHIIERDPDYANAYVGLVLINSDREHCDEAADARRRYLELTGNVADANAEGHYRQQCGA